MAKYRNDLPQLSDNLYLTDGGLETTLLFYDGFDLPDFAAFTVMNNEEGMQALRKYYRTYAQIARDNELGFILESATWRASSYWGDRQGYSDDALTDVNHKAIEFLSTIRDEFETDKTKMVISGCVGSPGDGYNPTNMMSEDEAERYHSKQIEILSRTDVDFVSAFTIAYVEEAIGFTRAAMKSNIPAVISFTVETDGRLPSGQLLKEAIEQVDSATGNGPAYYMINCAHPTHFENVLTNGESWLKRIRGIRANASCKSHAELDESEEIDSGDPVELGIQYKELKNRLVNLNVLGGCCGTDHRHIEQIATVFLSRN